MECRAVWPPNPVLISGRRVDALGVARCWIGSLVWKRSSQLNGGCLWHCVLQLRNARFVASTGLVE
jgi:hypothetical protein